MSRDAVSTSSFYGEVRRYGYPYPLMSGSPLVTVYDSHRDDIRYGGKVRKGEFRKPLPYKARVAQSDVLVGLVEVFSDAEKSNAWVHSGYLGFNNGGLSVSVSNGELDDLLPSFGDVDRAVIKARNNVADRVASFGESIAELSGSVKTLTDSASKLDNFLKYSMRRQWGKAASAIGVHTGDKRHRNAVKLLKKNSASASDAWLHYNFGIAPIVSDMVSSLIVMSGDWSLRVTGTGYHITQKERNVVPLNWGLAVSGAILHYDLETSIDRGVYTRLDYSVSNKRLRDLSKFGLTDPAATAYALVPYTFLTDFVIPVSEVLRSQSATVGLDFMGGSSTRRTSVSRSIKNPRVKMASGSVISEIYTECSARGTSMDRIAYTGEPNPFTLYVSDPFRLFPAVTALSLLGSKLKSL